MPESVLLTLATFDDIVEELERRNLTYAFVYAPEKGRGPEDLSTAYKVAEGSSGMRLIGCLEVVKQELVDHVREDTEPLDEEDV